MCVWRVAPQDEGAVLSAEYTPNKGAVDHTILRETAANSGALHRLPTPSADIPDLPLNIISAFGAIC